MRVPGAIAADPEHPQLERAVTRAVTAFRRRRPLRGASLIVTCFGDALAPHGSSIWLTDLITLLEPFGLDSRLTRTSVFRLVRQGLLVARRVGRRSYYTLSEHGRAVFDEATRRIYASDAAPWDGIWTWLIFPATLPVTARRELELHGFAPLARAVWAHPHVDAAGLALLQRDLAGVPCVSLRAPPQPSPDAASLRSLVSRAWDLSRLESGYVSLIRHFQPISDALADSAAIDPALAFRVRTLLVHEYRRVLLRDPQLPDELLPNGWPGREAFQLCRSLYTAVLAPSELFLEQRVAGIAGPLPPADATLAARFGGLNKRWSRS